MQHCYVATLLLLVFQERAGPHKLRTVWLLRLSHICRAIANWVIDNLGPLELILNTPSHHRVHHGRNRYCVDKNFAGTLIIWDRIFGTFEAEKEKVVYGLTHPINSFEPFKVQFHHLLTIWTTFWATPGFFNKFSVIFKGPGWGPGKPRLGLNEEIPEVKGKEVPFSSSASRLLQTYAVVQFALLLTFYEETYTDKAALSQVTLLLRACFIILTLTSIGFLLDQRPKAAVLETFRCLVFLMLCRLGHLKPFIPSLSFAFEAALRSQRPPAGPCHVGFLRMAVYFIKPQRETLLQEGLRASLKDFYLI
ncbi:hypothetical protein J1605_002994 [Eschrichtius robustus]|uniref:Alkylglycerol monooxygenase n=1 Tax=Eschrichtius robustus TaxID=9764 RepID=A0AB34HUP0_ESCRO|nr:hypothetical protein J1605_002994 [Eschrichtius robustus]